jgi:hypothetical protein
MSILNDPAGTAIIRNKDFHALGLHPHQDHYFVKHLLEVYVIPLEIERNKFWCCV